MQRFVRSRLAAAALLGATLALVSPMAAQAAPPYETEAQITSLDFTQSTIESGSRTELAGTWALPDHAASPAGFSVPLPADLRGLSDAFPLVDPDGVEMGQCTVTATELFCDIDAEYLAAHPVDVSGTFNFWVEATTEVTEETTVDYAFGDVDVSVTVTPEPGDCTTDCDFDGLGAWKWGGYDRDRDAIDWTVTVPAPIEGMAGDEVVEVVDTPGPGQVIDPAGTLVYATNEVGPGWRGQEEPINFQPLPTEQFDVSSDGATVTFTSQAGYFYHVHYTTLIVDEGAQGTYGNEAAITIAGEDAGTATGEVVRQGGSGTGVGTDVGVFTITKDVLGEVSGLEGIAFSGTYTVTTPAGDVVEGTFDVADGDTWRSPQFPRDSIVTLTEDTPTGPDGIDWADPVFSQNDFTLPGGTVTAVSLVNEATVATGSFSASKVVDGPAADLVDPDSTFLLDYSYPAGEHFAAGSGTLELPADGTVIHGPDLPVGAVVTLAEQTPTAVEGATWSDPVLSQATVTIGRDELVLVTVTNTITPIVPEPPTATPATPAAPAPPATPQSLPVTGFDLAAGAFIAGAGLVAVGALLRMGRRTRA